MSSAAVIVIGAGGHAVVVADALLAAGRQVLGFTDENANASAEAGAGATVASRQLLGLPVLGSDADLARYRGAAVELANGIGGAGTLQSVVQGTLRRRVQQRLRGEGWRFCTVRHPQAIVSTHALLEDGAQVLAGAVVQALARVAEGAIVNTRALVEHHCEIGAFAHIAPGAVLCGEVIVGEECHVGAGAVVRQGLRLAARSVVGAGAVVVRDTAAGLVCGVPARPATGPMGSQA